MWNEFLAWLSAGPAPVGKIAIDLPVTRPAVSQHLRVLMNAGLVVVHHRGTLSFYEIDPEGVQAMREYLQTMWANVLDAFGNAAENEEHRTT